MVAGDAAVLVVTPDLAALAGVRAHLREVALRWRVGDVRTLELVATELLTNAIVHGRGRPILRVEHQGGERVRVEVGDAAPDRPQPVDPYDDHTRGLGLHIVAAVSAGWGVTDPAPGSKVVWADLDLAGDAEPAD
jgi:anti-sigma regulatory factor (Ser/Thr protein kinase)